MRKLDQRGVAALTAVIIIAVSTGATVAAPVIVDVADVDPDHPLYGLERLGERIRMVGDEDQMKERWGESVRMIERGKGVEHRAIIEEFLAKMEEVAPEDVETKAEIIEWMQQQMPGIGVIKAHMLEEACRQLKEDLPEVGELDNLCEEIENCKLLARENIDAAKAYLELCRERIENIANKYRHRVREHTRKCLEIDNILVDIDIYIAVKVRIHPVVDLAEKFTEKLEEFDNLLAEVRAMLEGAPENTAGKHAAERLIEVATTPKGRAVTAYDEGEVRRALTLIYAANMHLYNAKMILEHASEWEPEFREEWAHWRQDWAEVKQTFINEGTWENVLKNWEQYAENIRQRWEERLRWGR